MNMYQEHSANWLCLDDDTLDTIEWSNAAQVWSADRARKHIRRDRWLQDYIVPNWIPLTLIAVTAFAFAGVLMFTARGLS